MPGSSRRSKGCYRCRAKKVKCDEGVPECLRCVANGIKCPGYRPENELTFCSMNQVVESKVFAVPSKKTRVRKSASPRQKSVSVTRNHNASSPGDAQVVKDRGIIYTLPKETTLQAITRKMSDKLFTLSKPMATDWKDSALCLYFTDYVLEATDTNTSPGFLHGLPKLILANPDGLLAHAVAAVSLASFSNQVRSESLTVKSRQSYGKALIRVSRALSDKSQASSEETLGGILLLNMFEMFSGDHITVWKTHADGLAHILRVRGTVEQFGSERGSGMARGAHRVVMFKNLLHRRTPGVETALFDQHLQRQTASWAQASLACNRIARILPVADKVFAEDPLGDESSKDLLRVIALVTSEDKRFVQWQNSEAVKAIKTSTTGVSDHQQLEIAGWWNPYRAARIILLETLLRLLDRVHMHPDLSHMVPEMNRLRIKVDQDMHTMVYEICATVSDVLGTMKEGECVSRDTLKGSAIAGYTSVWPLGISLKMVKTLSVEQRSFILAQLSYINAALGIKQAQIIKKVG